MDKEKFDVILDASDENFAEDLKKALGVKPGDTIEFITPQFERVDGRAVTYFPTTKEEYDALKKMTPENIKKTGCQIWEVEDVVYWLFPWEWYNHIPEGYMVTDINGKEKPFEKGVTDDDKRFGCLAYGFVTPSICEHGNGMMAYCEPCGRIHGGG